MAENWTYGRHCGRPTKAGKPCQNPTGAHGETGTFTISCRVHRVPEDVIFESRMREAWNLGRGWERKSLSREFSHIVAFREREDGA